MARWMAIVALLLGVGLTAFESFSPADTREAPMVQAMEGAIGTPPTPRPLVEIGGTSQTSSDVSIR